MKVRRHPISGEPILFAPGRAGRPNAFGRIPGHPCPFCPGQEAETPPEIARCGDPWRVRVFPNRYPAAEGHEVIVDSDRHDDRLETIGHGQALLETYMERYRAHRHAPYVSLFKNEGEQSGASLDHIHSQLIPLPFIPPRIERQLAGFAALPCPLCASEETLALIEGNENFLRVCPWGAQHPYQQWIVPRRHQADFSQSSPGEIADLWAMLQAAAGAARSIAPALNVLFMNFPAHSQGHYYIDVFPRTMPVAGFELATGTFIDIIDSAAAARRLK